MKPEELRIGNLATYLDETIKVTGIITATDVEGKPFTRVNFIDLGDSYEYERGKIINWIKPIPLTEDILLKCGFKLRDDKFFGKRIKKYTYLEVNITGKRTIIYSEDGARFVDISYTNYLHQLQNLYFALTGEELKIEL
jgi:hypothetical protein